MNPHLKIMNPHLKALKNSGREHCNLCKKIANLRCSSCANTKYFMVDLFIYRQGTFKHLGPNAILGGLLPRRCQSRARHDRHGPGRQRNDGALQMPERDGEKTP